MAARGNYISGPKFCPIDGNWSEYDLWLPCSPMCGNGTSRRFRFCTNPEPSYNGKFCEGLNYEEEKCFTDCIQGTYVKTIYEMSTYCLKFKVIFNLERVDR